MARVVLLDGDVLAPGAESLVQLRLEAPVVAVWGDRFVIRRYSPALTIGGGRVLQPHPEKRRRLDNSLRRQLAALETNAIEEVVEAKLFISAGKLQSCRELSGDLGQSMERMEVLLGSLERRGRAVLMPVDNEMCALHSEAWNELSRVVEAGLQDFSPRKPPETGNAARGVAQPQRPQSAAGPFRSTAGSPGARRPHCGGGCGGAAASHRTA